MKYLADTLTVSRFVLGALAAFAILRGEWEIAVLWVLLGGLSDAFDGVAARKWPLAASRRFYSRWLKPKEFDESADGFFCAVLVFAPAARLILANLGGWSDGWVPLWFSIPLVIVECLLTPFFILATQKLRPADAFQIDVLHGWYCALLMFGTLTLVTFMAFSSVVAQTILLAYLMVGSILIVVKWDRATTRPGVVYEGNLTWKQFLCLQWK